MGDSSARERVCGEIASGIRCTIYTASDVTAALTLVRAEKPTLLLLSPEFARIHDKAIVEVVAELSPETVVSFVAPPPQGAETPAQRASSSALG